MNLEFNWIYKDYQLRAVPKNLFRFENSDENETIELLKWFYEDENRYCITLAYWKQADECRELVFVGDRMFEYIEDEDLFVVWQHMKLAQEILNERWE